MARTTTFTRGTGCYTCNACGRKTRDDGNGDSVHCHLCTECFELAGYANALSDNRELSANEWSNVASLKAAVAKLGGSDAFPELAVPAEQDELAGVRAWLAAGIAAGSNKVSIVRALAAWEDNGRRLSRREVFALIHAAGSPVADNTISRQFHLVRSGALPVSFA